METYTLNESAFPTEFTCDNCEENYTRIYQSDPCYQEMFYTGKLEAPTYIVCGDCWTWTKNSYLMENIPWLKKET